VAITVITAPSVEPLELADLKNDLKVDTDLTADDALIDALLTAGREWAEGFTNRAFITQTLELTLDTWPAGNAIRVPRPPLQSVSSIKYYDQDDTEYTLSSANYLVDTASEPGRIVLNSGQSWPGTALRPANGVVVRFVAGHGDAASEVPAKVIQAIRLTVGHWYENRLAVSGTGAVPKEVPFGVMALLWQDRMVNT